VYLKEMKAAYKRETGTASFSVALFTIAKMGHQPSFLSTGGWYMYMTMFCLAMKKIKSCYLQKVGGTGGYCVK
jgi:hypothetical protein